MSSTQRKNYDPITYWNKRKDPNSDAGREIGRVSFDTNYIRRNTASVDSVLELGPGIGRTFSSYDPGMQITTLDITRNYQEELARVARSAGLGLQQYFLADPREKYPFPDQEFDVGVSFQVFIHQPADIFEHSFAEMARVCKKVIVSVGAHCNTAKSQPHSAPHVFRHDYILQAQKIKRVISNLLIERNVLYFLIENDDHDLWMQDRG